MNNSTDVLQRHQIILGGSGMAKKAAQKKAAAKKTTAKKTTKKKKK